MRKCPNAIVPETMPLRDAAELLITNDFALLIAIDANDAIAGIVPESAVIRKLLSTVLQDDTVAAIMSRHVETVGPGVLLNSVLHLFRSACHSVIPVVESEGQIVGLLHRHDVVRLLLSENNQTLPGVDAATDQSEHRGPHYLKRSADSSKTTALPPADATDSAE